MNRQRLLELAGVTSMTGVSSNMGNPSQEPNAEIDGSADAGMRSPSTDGYNDLGDEGGTSFSGLRDQVKDALNGSPEEMAAALEAIMAVIDGEGDDMEGEASGDVEMELDLGQE